MSASDVGYATRSGPAAAAEPGHDTSRGDLNQVASGWLLTLAGVIASAVFTFAFSVVIARGLGAYGTGVFFTSTAVFTLLMSVSTFGAQGGAVRMLSRVRALGRGRQVRRLLVAASAPALVTSVVAGVGVFVFAEPLSRQLIADGDPEALVPFLRVLAPFLPVAALFDVFIFSTRGLGAIRPWVLIYNVFVPAARTLLVLAVVLSGVSLTGAYALAWAVPVVAGGALAGRALLRLVRRTEREVAAAEDIEPVNVAAEFWRFTAPLGIAGILQMTLTWLDTILLAALRGPAEAGVYKSMASIIMHGTFAQMAIVMVIGPLMSGLLSRGETRRAQEIYQTATWWITAVSWPVYISLAVFAPVALSIFGDEFAAGDTPMRILAVAMLIATCAGPASAALTMSGRSTWSLANVSAAVTVNVVLNLLLIPPFGMTGAAVAWSASIVINNVAPAVENWRFIGIRALGSGFWLVAGSSVALFGLGGGTAALLAGDDLSTALVVAPPLTLIYGALVWRARDRLRLEFLQESVRARRRGRASGASPEPDGPT